MKRYKEMIFLARWIDTGYGSEETEPFPKY
jgi:hypothetical protein